ncbi:plastocyanin/azurin family copper-binding protein [Sporichthya sp.]|uniref:plastocyanin/azurin family copper-binding protein n=1 Tax=Sporichthya sp. TaxID=65475 RepID=UPI0025F39881|nr:plastocyanin/azurin family copper-binding protein [Sporichthya sp.]
MRKVLSTQRTWTRGVAVSALALGMATVVPTQAGAQDSLASAGQFSVSQKNLQFNPFEMTVAVGDTITWTNHETDGNTIHSVVQKGGSEINSPDIPAETSFSWTFNTAQDYDIICRFHPDMFMTLHILDAKAAKAANKGTKGTDKKAATDKKTTDKKATDKKATDKKATGKKATDKAGTKTTKKGGKKKADAHADMDHDAHEESVKKSVPAAPPGPPDSTVPGIAGLPFAIADGRQR